MMDVFGRVDIRFLVSKINSVGSDHLTPPPHWKYRKRTEESGRSLCKICSLWQPASGTGGFKAMVCHQQLDLQQFTKTLTCRSFEEKTSLPRKLIIVPTDTYNQEATTVPWKNPVE
jgi:hypothetical protein